LNQFLISCIYNIFWEAISFYNWVLGFLSGFIFIFADSKNILLKSVFSLVIGSSINHLRERILESAYLVLLLKLTLPTDDNTQIYTSACIK
jgi:hypothetical protein